MQNTSNSNLSQKYFQFLQVQRSAQTEKFLSKSRLLWSQTKSVSDGFWSAATADLPSVWETASKGGQVNWEKLSIQLSRWPPYKSSCSTIIYDEIVAMFLRDFEAEIDLAAAIDSLYLVANLIPAKISDYLYSGLIFVLEQQCFPFASYAKLLWVAAQALQEEPDNLTSLLTFRMIDSVTNASSTYSKTDRVGNQKQSDGNQFMEVEVYFESISAIFEAALKSQTSEVDNASFCLGRLSKFVIDRIREEPVYKTVSMKLLKLILVNCASETAFTEEYTGFIFTLAQQLQSVTAASDIGLGFEVLQLLVWRNDPKIRAVVLESAEKLSTVAVKFLEASLKQKELNLRESQLWMVTFLRTVLETRSDTAYKMAKMHNLGCIALELLTRTLDFRSLEAIILFTFELLSIQEYFKSDQLINHLELLNHLFPILVFSVHFHNSLMALLVQLVGYAFDRQAEIAAFYRAKFYELLESCQKHSLLKTLNQLLSSPNSEIRELAADLQERFLEFARKMSVSGETSSYLSC